MTTQPYLSVSFYDFSPTPHACSVRRRFYSPDPLRQHAPPVPEYETSHSAKMTKSLSVIAPPKQRSQTSFPRHPLLTNPAQTRIHPRPPRPSLGSRDLSCFLCFFLCLCGFPGFSGSGSGSPARRQITKKALCRGGSTAQGFFGLLCSFGPQRWPR